MRPHSLFKLSFYRVALAVLQGAMDYLQVWEAWVVRRKLALIKLIHNEQTIGGW